MGGAMSSGGASSTSGVASGGTDSWIGCVEDSTDRIGLTLSSEGVSALYADGTGGDDGTDAVPGGGSSSGGAAMGGASSGGTAMGGVPISSSNGRDTAPARFW